MAEAADGPLLRLNFFSHGTLLMEEMAPSRRFYEEFLGLDVVQTSQVSLAIRLGTDTSVACVAMPRKVREPGREYLRYYNIGLTVGDAGDVSEARERAVAHADDYGIRQVGELARDGARVSFVIEDRDGNYWEILNEQPAN